MMLESLSAGCFCVHLSDRSSIPQLSLDTNRSPGYLSRVDRHRRERSPKQFPRRFFLPLCRSERILNISIRYVVAQKNFANERIAAPQLPAS